MFAMQIICEAIRSEINCCHDLFLSGLIRSALFSNCNHYNTNFPFCHYTGNIILQITYYTRTSSLSCFSPVSPTRYHFQSMIISTRAGIPYFHFLEIFCKVIYNSSPPPCRGHPASVRAPADNALCSFHTHHNQSPKNATLSRFFYSIRVMLS